MVDLVSKTLCCMSRIEISKVPTSQTVDGDVGIVSTVKTACESSR